MTKNPHPKGSMEYLDWATAQHTKATAKPKSKPTGLAATKVAPKKTVSREDRLMDLAGGLAKRQKRYSGGGMK